MGAGSGYAEVGVSGFKEIKFILLEESRNN